MHKLAPPPASPEVFTIEEAGAAFRMSRGAIRKEIAAGRITCIKLPGGGIRVRKADMDQYLQDLISQTVQQTAETSAIVDELIQSPRTPRQARLRRTAGSGGAA